MVREQTMERNGEMKLCSIGSFGTSCLERQTTRNRQGTFEH